jgi:hypothetical protein
LIFIITKSIIYYLQINFKVFRLVLFIIFKLNNFLIIKVNFNLEEIHEIFNESEVIYAVSQVYGSLEDINLINYLQSSNDNLKQFIITFINILNNYLKDFLTNVGYFNDISDYKEIIAQNLVIVKIFIQILQNAIIWIRDENNNYITI